jgi:hypothetical protein
MRLLIALTVCCFLAAPSASLPQVTAPATDRRIQAVVASVSPDRLRTLVAKLASFGTRHTLSDTASTTRGIGAARQWIFDELRRTSPRLQVSFDSHRLLTQGRLVRDVEIRNVIAVLPGSSQRRIYITAHYDSLNIPDQTANVKRPTPAPPRFDATEQPGQNFNVDAPGANDNGSGTALVLELARVLTDGRRQFDATLVFALWAGEEQGLIGALAHARRLAANKAVVVEAVFNSDIVGNSRGGDGTTDSGSVRVYADGPEDSMSRALARYVAHVGALYLPSHRVRLMARPDRFQRGSDHMPFHAAGYPAVVFREATEDYGRQHSARDTADAVDVAYLTQNARLNVAAVASLALAPAAPSVLTATGAPNISRGSSQYDAVLRWSRAPTAVTYRVYWRDTWTSDWQHSLPVGNVTEFVFPRVSIDNVVFGVAAVNAGGQESLISAYVVPARRLPELKFAP